MKVQLLTAELLHTGPHQSEAESAMNGSNGLGLGALHGYGQTSGETR